MWTVRGQRHHSECRCVLYPEGGGWMPLPLEQIRAESIHFLCALPFWIACILNMLCISCSRSADVEHHIRGWYMSCGRRSANRLMLICRGTTPVTCESLNLCSTCIGSMPSLVSLSTLTAPHTPQLNTCHTAHALAYPSEPCLATR